ncbi:MAG: hypothetical protein HYY18_21580 [Planctomycetes bacterium]|nr:hypothetical protein [Planctomycetota bacterium]
MKTAVLFCLLALPAAADGIVAGAAAAEVEVPRVALDRARKLDVLFGHQSVGGNLLDGLAALAGEDEERFGVERAEDPAPEWFEEHDGWGDFYAGENEDPFGKIEHFRRKIRDEGFGKRVAVASVKLCWIDFAGKQGEAKRTFEKYRDAMESLEKEFSKVKFVWWTAPLKTAENATRHEYNEMVRGYCSEKGKALFDIADLSARDGSKPSGRSPVLLAKYAEDEGHLNEQGRMRAAKAWWWLMARLAGWDGKSAGK